jgi:hypothetical protein
MSKKLTAKVIGQIKQEKLTIRPRWHFIFGATLSAIGLVITSGLVMLSLHLLRFRLTHPGIGAGRKLDFILTNLPWYIPVLALTGLVGGYYLLKRYDFSYRKNFAFILLAIIAGLLLGTYSLRALRLDDFLTRRGYFRELYGQNQQPGERQQQGRGRFR